MRRVGLWKRISATFISPKTDKNTEKLSGISKNKNLLYISLPFIKIGQLDTTLHGFKSPL